MYDVKHNDVIYIYFIFSLYFRSKFCINIEQDKLQYIIIHDFKMYVV